MSLRSQSYDQPKEDQDNRLGSQLVSERTELAPCRFHLLCPFHHRAFLGQLFALWTSIQAIFELLERINRNTVQLGSLRTSERTNLHPE